MLLREKKKKLYFYILSTCKAHLPCTSLGFRKGTDQLSRIQKGAVRTLGDPDT